MNKEAKFIKNPSIFGDSLVIGEIVKLIQIKKIGHGQTESQRKNSRGNIAYFPERFSSRIQLESYFDHFIFFYVLIERHLSMCNNET